MNPGAAKMIAIAYLVLGIGAIIAGATFAPMLYIVGGPSLVFAVAAFWIITRRNEWLGTGQSIWTARREWRSQRIRRS